jgi:hypothetical protein
MAVDKPPAVQAAVLVKALNGESNTQIAEDLGIHRHTVRAILAQPELDKMVQEGKTRLHQLIPKSLDSLEYALNKHKTPEAILILRATSVLPSEQEGSGAAVSINFGAMPRRGECLKST